MARACELDHLARAWRKVKANGGAPGVDGERLQDFEANLQENLAELRRQLLSGRYEPQDVRRVWVPKSSGGMRPLAILAIRDRIAQRAVYDVLAPLFEHKFLDCSYGFREARSIQDAADAVARWRGQGRHWVVDGDIKNCYETLDHGLLMRMLPQDIHDASVLNLIERWLKARILRERPERTPVAGTYQGGVISPLLCNVYLHPFDLVLTKLGMALVRYADDWVILCAGKTEAEACLYAATEALARLRLALNPYKTRIVHFDQGFAFVGTFFVRNERYCLAPQRSTFNPQPSTFNK